MAEWFENEDELNSKRLSYLYKIYSISSNDAERTAIAGYIRKKLADSVNSLSSAEVSAHDLLVYSKMLDKLQWETDAAKNDAQTKLSTEIARRIGNQQNPQGLTEVLSKQALLEAANVLEDTLENQDAVEDGQTKISSAIDTELQPRKQIEDETVQSVIDSDNLEMLEWLPTDKREALLDKIAKAIGWNNVNAGTVALADRTLFEALPELIQESGILQPYDENGNLKDVYEQCETLLSKIDYQGIEISNIDLAGLTEEEKKDDKGQPLSKKQLMKTVRDKLHGLSSEEIDSRRENLEQRKIQELKNILLSNAAMRAVNALLKDPRLFQNGADVKSMFAEAVKNQLQGSIVRAGLRSSEVIGQKVSELLSVDENGKLWWTHGQPDEQAIVDEVGKIIGLHNNVIINPIAVAMDRDELQAENEKIGYVAEKRGFGKTLSQNWQKVRQVWDAITLKSICRFIGNTKEKLGTNAAGYGLSSFLLAADMGISGGALYGTMSAVNAWVMPAYDKLGREMDEKEILGWSDRFKYRAKNMGRVIKEEWKRPAFRKHALIKTAVGIGVAVVAGGVIASGASVPLLFGAVYSARALAAVGGRTLSLAYSTWQKNRYMQRVHQNGWKWVKAVGRIFGKKEKTNQKKRLASLEDYQQIGEWKRNQTSDVISLAAVSMAPLVAQAVSEGLGYANDAINGTGVNDLTEDQASNLLTKAQEQGMLRGFADDKTVMVGDTEVKVSELTPEQIASLPLDEQQDILKDIIKADNTLDNVSELSARVAVAEVENPAALLNGAKDLIPADGITIGEGEAAKVITVDNLANLSPEEQRTVLEEIINAANGIDNVADLQNHVAVAALDNRELDMLANAAKGNIPAEGIHIGEKTITSETDISTLSSDEKRALLENVVKNNETVTLDSLKATAGDAWTAYEDIRTLAADIEAVTPIVNYSHDLLPVTIGGQEVTSENVLTFISDETNGEANRLNLLEAMINKSGDYVENVADLQNHAEIAQLYDNGLDVNPRADALFRTARDGLVEGVDKDVVMIKIGEEEAVKLSSITDEQWHNLDDATQRQVLEQIIKADGGPSTLAEMESSVDTAIDERYENLADFDGTDKAFVTQFAEEFGLDAKATAMLKHSLSVFDFDREQLLDFYKLIDKGQVESLPDGMSAIEYIDRFAYLKAFAGVAQAPAIKVIGEELGLNCDGNHVPSAAEINLVHNSLQTIVYGNKTLDYAYKCEDGSYVRKSTVVNVDYVGPQQYVTADNRIIFADSDHAPEGAVSLRTENYGLKLELQSDCAERTVKIEQTYTSHKPDCPSCEGATYINGGAGGDIALGDGTVDTSVAPLDIKVNMTDPYAVYRTAHSGAPGEGQNPVDLAQVDGKVKGVNGEYLKVDDKTGFTVPGTEERVERGEVYVRAPEDWVSEINNLPTNPENAPIVTDDKITFVYQGDNGAATFEMTKGENGTWRGRFMTGNQEHILDVPSCRALAAKVSEYGMFRVHSVDGAEQSLPQGISISDKHQATLNANATKDAPRGVRAGQPYTPETTQVSVSAEQIRSSIVSGQAQLNCTGYNPITGRATFSTVMPGVEGAVSVPVPSEFVKVIPKGEFTYSALGDDRHMVSVLTQQGGRLEVTVGDGQTTVKLYDTAEATEGRNVIVLNPQSIERGVTQVLSDNNVKFNGDESIKLHSPLTEKVVNAVNAYNTAVARSATASRGMV